MKNWLLAVALLLGASIVPAYADYIVIIIDPLKKADPPPMGGVGTRPSGGSSGPGTTQPGPQQPAPPMPEQPQGTRIIDFDAQPSHAVAIVEIKEKADALHDGFYGRPQQGIKPALQPGPIDVTLLAWGSRLKIKNQMGFIGETRVELVPNPPNSSLANRRQELEEKATPPTGSKDKPDPLAVLTLADWYLKHGYLDDFGKVMDQFAKDESNHPAAKAYLQVKKDLEISARTPKADPARAALLQNYKPLTITESLHYIAFYPNAQRVQDIPPEVKTRLVRLEKNMKGYYYWFALRGIPLPVPGERLPVVVTYHVDELKPFRDQMTATPAVSDGFIGRREGLLVLSSKRLDPQYAELERMANTFWTLPPGLDPSAILRKPESAFLNGPREFQDIYSKACLGTLAIVQTVMETDGERAGVTHNGSRQLLFASGLAKRSVSVPEWVQFGIGSFFETPVGSPYISTGAASSEYLPLWREMRQQNYLGNKPSTIPGAPPQFSAAATLRKVITDDFFREAQRDATLGNIRRARASSWALMYFLAQGNNKLNGSKAELDGLQRYFKELAKLPRDMELDDTALLTCFCQSFGLMKGTQIDEQEFERFANKWDTFMSQERMELEDLVIRLRMVTNKYAVVTADGEKIKAPETVNTAPSPYHPAPVGTTTTQPNGGAPRP